MSTADHLAPMQHSLRAMLQRLALFIGPAEAERVAAATAVRVEARRNDHGGWSLYPADAHTCQLLRMGAADALGSFGSEGDAARCAARNCWEVVPAIAP